MTGWHKQAGLSRFLKCQIARCIIGRSVFVRHTGETLLLTRRSTSARQSLDASKRAAPVRAGWLQLLSLKRIPELELEPITIQSKTGITMHGASSPGRTATIVLTHGYGGNQNEILPVANFLHDAGFRSPYIRLPQVRPGGAIAFAALERRDLMSRD